MCSRSLQDISQENLQSAKFVLHTGPALAYTSLPHPVVPGH